MKTRLTITLSDSTLKGLDQLIDKKTIRNRSHAIEHILGLQLKPRITTALILAGGHNTHEEPLRPLTLLDGKPLILYILDHLKLYGVEKIIIATSKAGREIQKLLGDGSQHQVQIEYFFESKPLGTAGAIRQAHSLLKKKPFYVVAGDVLTSINLSDMLEFHTRHEGLMTMAVKPRLAQNTYDSVFIQGHTVVDFQKSLEKQKVSIVNAGLYIFEPEIFSFIPDKSPAMLEKDVFPKLAQSGRLLAYPFQGIWFDITSDTNYKSALQRIRSSHVSK